MNLGTGMSKRGGSWNNNPANCRSAYRNYDAPANRDSHIGFRVFCAVLPALF
jgi:formylglycine-generating enzyme required for sulfatase activity